MISGPLRELSIDDRGNPLARASDFWREGQWDVPKVQLLHSQAGLPQQVVDDIIATPILTGEPDTPRWTLSNHGNFSLGSTWETIRAHRPTIPGLRDLWNTGLTTSISIFSWRLLSNRIPVDTKLQWRKIALASKCLCCPYRPGVESLQHFFIQGAGAGAVSVWREFDGWFAGSSPHIRINDTIPDRLEVWARRTQQSATLHLSRITPILILWFIWAERNKSRHNDSKFRPYNVVWQVQMHIQNLISNGRLDPTHWRGVNLNMSIPAQVVQRSHSQRVMPVKWIPPDLAEIKLNTAGAFVTATGKAGGGGVIRDHLGRLLAAFSTPCIAQLVLEAELKAIHQGLLLAKDFDQPIWVETDAAQAISLIRKSEWGPAHIRLTMAQLFLFKQNRGFRISFIHREGNKAADHLAASGIERDSAHHMNAQTAPRILKALIRLEEMGIPNIRMRDDNLS